MAQHQAHSAEHDYEEVIHLLETEITELKKQLSGKKTMTLEVNEVREYCCIFTYQHQLSLSIHKNFIKVKILGVQKYTNFGQAYSRY